MTAQVPFLSRALIPCYKIQYTPTTVLYIASKATSVQEVTHISSKYIKMLHSQYITSLLPRKWFWFWDRLCTSGVHVLEYLHQVGARVARGTIILQTVGFFYNCQSMYLQWLSLWDMKLLVAFSTTTLQSKLWHLSARTWSIDNSAVATDFTLWARLHSNVAHFDHDLAESKLPWSSRKRVQGCFWSSPHVVKENLAAF